MSSIGARFVFSAQRQPRAPRFTRFSRDLHFPRSGRRVAP